MRFSTTEPVLTYAQRMRFAVILVVLFLVVLFTTSCRFETRLPTTEPIGVARMVILTDGQEYSYCTMWKIKDGMALTAGHCCHTPEEIVEERLEGLKEDIFWRMLGGEEIDLDAEIAKIKAHPPVITYTAKGHMAVKGAMFSVLRDDDSNDVCVLKGAMGGMAIGLASHDPAIGEKVWTEGYPKETFLISEGYWSGADSMDTVVASTAIWGGASGSPVLNTDGQAVGLLNRYRPPMSNMTLMVPLEWLVANVASAERVVNDDE